MSNGEYRKLTWADQIGNYLAGNGDYKNPELAKEISLQREKMSNAIGNLYKNRQGENEFNRQIAQQASDQYAQLATQYPELWAAKRKAAFQSGALSALGGT